MTSVFWATYTTLTGNAHPQNICDGRPATKEFCAMVRKAEEQIPDRLPNSCKTATYSTLSVDPNTGMTTPLHKDRVVPTWLLKIRLLAAKHFSPTTFFDRVGLCDEKENVFYIMPGPVSAEALLRYLQPKNAFLAPLTQQMEDDVERITS